MDFKTGQLIRTEGQTPHPLANTDLVNPRSKTFGLTTACLISVKGLFLIVITDLWLTECEKREQSMPNTHSCNIIYTKNCNRYENTVLRRHQYLATLHYTVHGGPKSKPVRLCHNSIKYC